MISGLAFLPAWISSAAASRMAWVCISVISG